MPASNSPIWIIKLTCSLSDPDLIGQCADKSTCQSGFAQGAKQANLKVSLWWWVGELSLRNVPFWVAPIKC